MKLLPGSVEPGRKDKTDAGRIELFGLRECSFEELSASALRSSFGSSTTPTVPTMDSISGSGVKAGETGGGGSTITLIGALCLGLFGVAVVRSSGVTAFGTVTRFAGVENMADGSSFPLKNPDCEAMDDIDEASRMADVADCSVGSNSSTMEWVEESFSMSLLMSLSLSLSFSLSSASLRISVKAGFVMMGFGYGKLSALLAAASALCVKSSSFSSSLISSSSPPSFFISSFSSSSFSSSSFTPG